MIGTAFVVMILICRASAEYGTSDDCRFNLTATAEPQAITSPGYPDNYTNLDCEWVIYAQDDTHQISFVIDDFDLNPNDYIQVLYYTNVADNEVYLESEIKGSINSETTLLTGAKKIEVLTTYHAADKNFRGFSANFYYTNYSEYKSLPTPNTPTPINESMECLFNLNATTKIQTITSPDYPHDNSKSHCKWKIEAPDDSYELIFIVNNLKINDDALVVSVNFNASNSDGSNGEYYSEFYKSFNQPVGIITGAKNMLVQAPGVSETIPVFSASYYYIKASATSTTAIPLPTTAPSNYPPQDSGEMSTAITTPTPDIPQINCSGNASVDSYNSLWWCEYINWRIDFYERWLKEFLTCRMENNIEDTPIPDCPNVLVTCTNSEQQHTIPHGNCNTTYCTDGLYEDGSDLQTWQKDLEIWKKFFKIFKSGMNDLSN